MLNTGKPKPLASILILFLAFLMVAMPLQTIVAQDIQTACADAKTAAQANFNGATWFTVGCLLGVFGVLIASVVEPTPSATDLMGKSAKYVSTYTDCYQSKGRKLQQTKAINACLIGTLSQAVVFYIYFTKVILDSGDEAP